MDLDEFMAESNARARHARAAARGVVIAVGMILAIGASFLFLAMPNQIGGMGSYAGPLTLIVPGVGVVGVLVGFAWMVRILRADPEPDAKAWRYRRRP